MNMKILHPDAAAIDRVGRDIVKTHFALTRQALDYWLTKGVPKGYRKAMILLGATHHHAMPEMEQPRELTAAA